MSTLRSIASVHVIVGHPSWRPGGPVPRTTTSYDGGPMFIVDGVIQMGSAMSALTPGSIQSIEVVKGEAATKLYGTKAASGVIVIKTNRRPPPR